MAINNRSEAASSSEQPSQFTDILLQIAVDPEAAKNKQNGQKIAEKIYADQTSSSGNLNFFKTRAARWIEVYNWSNGTQDMTQFLDFFNVSNGDGAKAYVKIDMTPIMVGPQFVNTLVESMAKTEEYACVTAVDAGSLNEKDQRKLDALFRMHEAGTIDDLQQQAGVMLEPPNAYVPDDELSATVYFKLEDRLPKEIEFEEKLSGFLSKNQYERVLKRKFLRDLIVHNVEVSKIEKDSYGNKRLRRCIPQNVLYNFFIGDTGRHEISYIGEVYNMKVSDVRMKFGKTNDRPDGLTEKDLFELAKYSTTSNTGLGFNYTWSEQYAFYNNKRPWDDYTIFIFDFEYKVEESEYYVNKPDSFGKDNIAPKQGIPQPKSEKATVLKRGKTRWYNGVYAPIAKKMIYWGLPEMIILPYNDTSCSLSSYTINIPNNNGEYVPSLFERSLEPLREYALTKLKRKQLIAKLRPSGVRIDVESARNVDLGTGDTIPWEEILRIYDQTGNEIWSSKGINPNEREAPSISQTAQDDTVQKIINLTSVLNSCLMEIRSLLGVPYYRDGADVGDRTAAKLAAGQQEASFNVTDFVPNAHNQFMEEVLYKICLLEWTDVVTSDKEGANDLINTKFDIEVRMKVTDYEKQMLEQNIQIWSKVIDGDGNPLLTPKDAFKIRNIQNYQMAELYLANVVESNKRRAEQERQKRAQENIESQTQSATAAAQQQQQMQQDKLDMDSQLKNVESKEKKEQILLQGILQIYNTLLTPKAGGDGLQPNKPMIPPELQSLANMVFNNIAIPLMQENQDMAASIAQQQQMQQQQQEEQQEQQGQPQQQQPQDISQPQMQQQ